MIEHLIVVTGATGKVGSRVAARLTQAGKSVRAVSRRSDPIFDWTDPSTWPNALSGAHSVFVSFYPDLAMPGAEAIIERFTASAKDCDLQHVVLLSGRGE